jgi:Baseplate J-like protein
MKTQILHLESHDDVNSTRDKMVWGQTPRILLVWPPGEPILRKRLDLVLLQRHSQSMGAQLALVTRDPEVRFQAGDLSIPVFSSIRQAQNSHWRPSRRERIRQQTSEFLRKSEGSPPITHPDLIDLRDAAHPQLPPWRKIPWIRLAFFTGGVTAVLAIASMFIPGAEIVLVPASQTQEAIFTAQSSGSIETISQAGIIPAREIRAVVEGRDQIPASGILQLQDTEAEGVVEFTNLTDKEVTIPVGTVIRSLDDEPVRFSTTTARDVPAGPGETVSVSIQALTRGADGNLPAGRVVAIQGPLGLSLTVTNPTSTHGGSNVTASTPTVLDRTKLYNRLLTALKRTAFDEIESSLEPGEILIMETPELVEVVEEIYTPTEQEAAENLALRLQVAFHSFAVQSEALQVLAGSILDAGLPDGYRPTSQAPQIENISLPEVTGDGEARWRVHSERQVVADISGDQVITLSLGKTPEGASNDLQGRLELAKAPQITLIPSWWPRLPYLPIRIQIRLDPLSEKLTTGNARPGG